ncbi:MAG TPA: HIT family protein [Thermoplasmata archaeon]|nr:HIT family protein [Thermoplasmata archaeon]
MAPGPDPPACIFCDIIHRRSPAFIFYEDDTTLAFLDLFPFTRGHALVVPKIHVDRLTELPADRYVGFLTGLAAVCRRMERLSTHYNVALNQGSLAGQIVFHLHFHIIPRYSAENPFRTPSRDRLRDADAQALVAQLTAP